MQKSKWVLIAIFFTMRLLDLLGVHLNHLEALAGQQNSAFFTVGKGLVVAEDHEFGHLVLMILASG